MEIRPAGREDVLAILEIRNHPVSRAFSYQSEPIDAEQHISWFDRQYLSGGDNHCFVLETPEGVVGYCRLDKLDGLYRVSIAIHPERQGRGLGSALLLGIMKNMPAGTRLKAEVLSNNSASLAFFLKHGFEHIGRTDDEDLLEREV
jgi:L-amino acid N-acyltransferase YncA